MATADDTLRTAVNQAPGGGTDYPFAPASAALGGYVLDFYLSYADQACGFALPFTLTVAGDALTVTAAGGETVVSASVAEAVVRSWGTRDVYQWDVAAGVVRLVATSLPDGSGVLDPRTCDRLPARVTSLRVGMVGGGGAATIVAGYNVSVSGAAPASPPDGGRYVSTINIDAVPGAGLGRVGGCEQLVPAVRKINDVGPDCAGNFHIEFDACFQAAPPLAVTGVSGGTRTAAYSAEANKHAIEIRSDCHPCCDCDYFVRTYRGLKRVWDRWKGVGEVLTSVRDLYASNLARWEASRQCRMDNPARLVTSTDTSCKVFVGGSFCNMSTFCVGPLELRFTFKKYKVGVEVPWTGGAVSIGYVGGTGHEGIDMYPPRITGPIVQFLVDSADPEDTTLAKMKFCLADCAADETLGVTMTVHVPTPPPKFTGETYDLPLVIVPADVVTTWGVWGVGPGAPVRAVLQKAVGMNPNVPRFTCGC